MHKCNLYDHWPCLTGDPWATSYELGCALYHYQIDIVSLKWTYVQSRWCMWGWCSPPKLTLKKNTTSYFKWWCLFETLLILCKQTIRVKRFHMLFQNTTGKWPNYSRRLSSNSLLRWWFRLTLNHMGAPTTQRSIVLYYIDLWCFLPQFFGLWKWVDIGFWNSYSHTIYHNQCSVVACVMDCWESTCSKFIFFHFMWSR